MVRRLDPRTPLAKGDALVIFAVMMVRNEADILRTNVLYHLASGIDHILIVDNGSIDGTAGILEELARTNPVTVFSRPGPFHQAETTTELAREAFRRGAHWVLPIDADEFFYASGGRLRDVLDDTAAGAIGVEVVNFVQRREQACVDPRALLTMTRRVPEPIGSSGEAAELVESGRIAYVECRYPPKYLSRASIALQIHQGNHGVSGLVGPIETTTAIVCLHAPLRARAALVHGKVEQGRRVEDVNHYLQQAWHVRRWRRLAGDGPLDAEWSANSYLDDCLDVSGARHSLVVDTRLHDLVLPWLEDAAGSVPLAREPVGLDSELRLGQLEQGVEFLMGELRKRDLIIQERDKGIEWLRGVVRDHEMTVAELEKAIAWLQNEVAHRERQLESLRAPSAAEASQPPTRGQ